MEEVLENCVIVGRTDVNKRKKKKKATLPTGFVKIIDIFHHVKTFIENGHKVVSQ
jgi:hypothetical protein